MQKQKIPSSMPLARKGRGGLLRRSLPLFGAGILVLGLLSACGKRPSDVDAPVSISSPETSWAQEKGGGQAPHKKDRAFPRVYPDPSLDPLPESP